MNRPISVIEADLVKAKAKAEAASEIGWEGPASMVASAWKNSEAMQKRVDALQAELAAARKTA